MTRVTFIDGSLRAANVSGLEPACVNILVTQGGIKETQSADGRPRASLSVVYRL